MQLKRIKEITNIGRFCSCKGIAGIEFFPTTIIFANNGNGKSTFTSILRSLQTGNNNILIGKKTLGSAGAKKVEIDFEDGGKTVIAKFESKKWQTDPTDKIFIFDTKFIAENVFDGEKMSDDHKANLHKVVVGSEGKKYAEAVTSFTVKIKECERTKSTLVAQYSGASFSRIHKLEQFIAIPKDLEIDNHIAEKKQELQFANQLKKPADLELESPDFSELKITLDKKIASVHDNVEKIIKEHAQKHIAQPNIGLLWLSQGNTLTKDETCPYCGQDTSEVSDLVNSYKTYFDTTYQGLQKEISRASTNFIDWDVDESLKILLEEIEGWHKIINQKGLYDKLIEKIKSTNLKVNKNALQVEVEKKSKDFNHQVPKGIIDAVAGSVSDIQTEIDAYNIAINVFKSKVSSNKPEDIEKDLAKLIVIKERHETKWDNFCDNYASNESITTDLKSKRKIATKELSDYSQKMLATYQTSINSVLERIGADFRIKDLCEQQDLRKSEAIFCGFDLEFFGQYKVGINGTEDKPHFKNSLSEGDKSSLAFAFFVAVLTNNSSLKDSLVVFDDPISSFDSDRKKATAQILSSIKNDKGESPEQILVLTHEQGFLIRLHKEFPSALYLKITPDGLNGTIKKSTFDRLNVYESFLKPDAYEILDRMKKCVDSNNPVDKNAHEDCRIILENALEAKYYLELKDDISKHAGLGGYIVTLTTGGQMTHSLGDEFKKMLSDIHEPHHKTADASKSANSDGDIKAILRTSLDLLKKI